MCKSNGHQYQSRDCRVCVMRSNTSLIDQNFIYITHNFFKATYKSVQFRQPTLETAYFTSKFPHGLDGAPSPSRFKSLFFGATKRISNDISQIPDSDTSSFKTKISCSNLSPTARHETRVPVSCTRIHKIGSVGIVTYRSSKFATHILYPCASLSHHHLLSAMDSNQARYYRDAQLSRVLVLFIFYVVLIRHGYLCMYIIAVSALFGFYTIGVASSYFYASSFCFQGIDGARFWCLSYSWAYLITRRCFFLGSRWVLLDFQLHTCACDRWEVALIRKKAHWRFVLLIGWILFYAK